MGTHSPPAGDCVRQQFSLGLTWILIPYCVFMSALVLLSEETKSVHPFFHVTDCHIFEV